MAHDETCALACSCVGAWTAGWGLDVLEGEGGEEKNEDDGDAAMSSDQKSKERVV